MRGSVIQKEVSAQEAQEVFAERRQQGRTLVGAMEGASPIITAQEVAVARDETRILAKIRALAAAAGDDWYYRYPVKNNRTGQIDTIEGPSIKCANNVARLYGNCQVDLRALDEGDAWLFYARFVDLETGFSLTRAYQQRKAQKSIGGKDDGRALDIAFQIGQSKALRNVICNALDTFANYAFEEAKNSLVEKIGKAMDKTRQRILDRLREMEVDVLRVEHVVGRASSEWLAPDMARIIAEIKSVDDGMASASETWPIKEPPIDATGEKVTQEAKMEEKTDEKKPKTETKNGGAETKDPLEIPDYLRREVYKPPALPWTKASAFYDAMQAELLKCTSQSDVEALFQKNGERVALLAQANPDLATALHDARGERLDAMREGKRA